MKTRQSLLIIMLLIFSVASSQDANNKWYFGLGVHATDHTSVNGVFDNFFDTDDYSFGYPFSKITIARRIAKNLAIDFQASGGDIENKRLGIEKEIFLLAGLGLRYSPLSESTKLKWLDPYVRVGGNYHRYSYKGVFINETHPYLSYDKDYKEVKEIHGKFKGKNDNFVINGGVGINFWITRRIGLNIESQYNWVTDYSKNYADFFHHSASIVFKVGNADRDKDGVLDKDDKCPTIPGLPEFQGCPDTDGDGIPDNEDQCPNEAGPKENNGCPWLDSDGDGVLDKDDKCPNEAGPKENNGCPWLDSDGDGVLDKDDKCPNEAGPKENNGCPWTEVDVTSKLQNILFKFNSSALTTESIILVKEAANMLNDASFEGKKFYVDGHTDRKGTDAVNNRISKERAQSVVDGLINNGIDKDRLTARGFGKSKPICTQTDVEKGKYSQEECDHMNRRVEVLDQASEKKVEIKTKEILRK